MATLVCELTCSALILCRSLLRWRISLSILRLRLSWLIIRSPSLAITCWIGTSAPILWRRHNCWAIVSSCSCPWVLACSRHLCCRLLLLRSCSGLLIGLILLVALILRFRLLLVWVYLISAWTLRRCVNWAVLLCRCDLSWCGWRWGCRRWVIFPHLFTLTPNLWFPFLPALFVHLL